MKKFLNRITPSFIHRINHHLLLNNSLGWQLQLPLITWLWLLSTLITLPVPLLYQLDMDGNDDMFGTILIGVFLGVLQFFLYGYLLLQFNTTKSYGKYVFLHGLKEQVAYFFVMLLCLSQVILYPLIIDYRKGHIVTEDQIKKEARIYNQARHYFMDAPSNYRYFPNDQYFVRYMEEDYGDKYQNSQDFYYHEIEPLMQKYFTEDNNRSEIDQQYTRDGNNPKLYYIGNQYLNESYEYIKDSKYYSYDDNKDEKFKYQVGNKTDKERLNEIQEFIRLYKKYQYEWQDIKFYPAEKILANYKSNRFQIAVEYGENFSIDHYAIDNVHYRVMRAKYKSFDELFLRLMICAHVALVFAVLFFIFKNIRIREFILSFVYSALLALLVGILTIITDGKEGLAVHTLLAIFLIGFVLALGIKTWGSYSSIKTILVALSNLFFAYVPIYFYGYFYEYLRWGRYPYEYCDKYPEICTQHTELIQHIAMYCLWGGPLFYLLVISIWYKKVYEKLLALPLNK